MISRLHMAAPGSQSAAAKNSASQQDILKELQACDMQLNTRNNATVGRDFLQSGRVGSKIARFYLVYRLCDGQLACSSGQGTFRSNAMHRLAACWVLAARILCGKV